MYRHIQTVQQCFVMAREACFVSTYDYFAITHIFCSIYFCRTLDLHIKINNFYLFKQYLILPSIQVFVDHVFSNMLVPKILYSEAKGTLFVTNLTVSALSLNTTVFKCYKFLATLDLYKYKVLVFTC